MKISEVTIQSLADFLRLDDPTDVELAELEEMKESAIAEIKSYTGLPLDEMDKHADLTHAFKMIVADMFDNRNYQTEKSLNYNKAVITILNMYSVNLL